MTVRGLAIHSWRSTAIIASSRLDGRPTRIVGNFIGTAADGITARGNGSGVDLRPDALIDGAILDFVVGGDGADRNVIAASVGIPGNGLTVGPGRQPDARIRVEGNLIGIGANGEALGNRSDGVLVIQPNPNNGFNLTVKSNVIVANGSTGVSLGRSLSSTTATSRGQVRIDDNWIGLTPDGRSLPNAEVGISVGGPVGGVQRARLVGNRIGAHTTPVRLFNQVTNPSAPQNLALIIPAELPAGGTPIDLGGSGPTPNDPGDGDNGANFLLNTPVLLGASFNDRGDRLRVSYQIDTPATARRVAHFYRRDGERLLYLGEDGYPGGTDTAELVLTAPLGNGTEIYALTELQSEVAVSSELSAVPVTVQARQAQASALPVREASGALLRYTLQLDPPPATAVTLRYRSIAGSAQAGADFTSVSGQVTVSPASPTATVDVPLLNDSLVEVDEGLVLEVDGGSDFAIGSAFAEGTIVDDDLLPQDQGQYTPLSLDSLDGRNGFRIDHPRGGTATLADAGEFDGTPGRDLALGLTRLADVEGPAALHLIPNLAPPFAATLSLPAEGGAQFPRWADELDRIARPFPAAMPLFRGAGNRGSLAIQRSNTVLVLDGMSGALPASSTLGAQSSPPNGVRIAAFGGDRAVPLGDLNGDGLEDLGVLPVSGAVSVVYGRPPGTPLPTSTSQLDGSNGFRISFGNSRFKAFAVGDIDGDGFDDLVVDETNDFPVIARSYLVRGRASFPANFAPSPTSSVVLPAEIDLARDFRSGDFDGDGHADLVIAPNNVFSEVQIRFGDGSVAGTVNSTRRVTIRQAFPGDGLGSSIAVLPDFDGDGRADLALGLPGSDQPQTGAGQVAVLYGRGNWPSVINLANPPDSTVRLLSGRLQARAGTAVAAIGDLNGDGRGELAVTAPTVGRSYVVFSDDAIFRATAEARPQVPASGAVYDSAGGAGEIALLSSASIGLSTLPAGDVDGDGRGDLLIARGADAGQAYALLPGALLASAGSSIDLGGALPSGASVFRRASQGEVQSALAHAAGGDFNGDGRDDLAFLSGDRARVALVFGRAGGLPGFVDPFDGATGTRTFELGGSDGQSLAFLGDNDGDGFDELGVLRGRGQVDVIFGNASGTPRRSSLTAPTALQPIDLSPQARLGRIRSGGVPADSFAIGLVDGSHAVIFGNPTGLPPALDLGALGAAGVYLRTPRGPGGGFDSGISRGVVVGTGDLDGDGIDDLAMGYRQPSSDGSPALRVALLRGRAGWPTEIDVSSSDPALVQGRILLRDLDAEPLTGIAGLRDRNGDGRRELLLSLAAAEGHDDKSGKALLLHGFALPFAVQTELEIEDLVPPGRGLTLRGALRKSEGTLANGQPFGDIDGDGREDLVFGASIRKVGGELFPNGARTFLLRGSALPE
jgi:hypothetical protein